MLANAWSDSVFPANQYASFYEKLGGPKRLQLRPGDHATPELTGLFGLPNDVWRDTGRWFDHYLRGVDNGVDREQPVQLESRSGGGYEGYPDWKSVAATDRKIALAGSTTIHANVDSGADGGIVLLSGLLDQVTKLPPMASVPLLPRRWAAVWQSERYAAPSGYAAPPGCTPRSRRPPRAAPSWPTSTTWARSASASWSPTRP